MAKECQVMKGLRKHLYRLLGQQRYLWLVSLGYFFSYRMGFLRRNPDYAWHYFARKLIRPGDHIIDIGANLGYFAVLFADWVGPRGRVWAVEPIPLYRRILSSHLGHRPQAIIIPYALGPARSTVSMGIPGPQPHRHGLTRILEKEETSRVAHPVRVNMQTPGEVFTDLPRLDYLKCDVEGYEMDILPLFESFFRMHQPLVQVEVASPNRAPLFAFFSQLDYRAAALQGGRLKELADPREATRGDLLFFPASRRDRLAGLFAV